MKTFFSKFVPLTILVVLIVHGIIKNETDGKKLSENYKYGIMHITKRSFGLTKKFIEYKYKNIEEHDFDRVYIKSTNNAKQYDRFVIQFNPENPKINKVLYNYPVLNDSIEAPLEGWDEIPYYIKEVPLE